MAPVQPQYTFCWSRLIYQANYGLYSGYQVYAGHLRPGHERHAGGGVQTSRQRVQPELSAV